VVMANHKDCPLLSLKEKFKDNIVAISFKGIARSSPAETVVALTVKTDALKEILHEIEEAPNDKLRSINYWIKPDYPAESLIYCCVGGTLLNFFTQNGAAPWIEEYKLFDNYPPFEKPGEYLRGCIPFDSESTFITRIKELKPKLDGIEYRFQKGIKKDKVPNLTLREQYIIEKVLEPETDYLKDHDQTKLKSLAIELGETDFDRFALYVEDICALVYLLGVSVKESVEYRGEPKVRAKLICRHSPDACWISKFSEDHEGIKFYAYPMPATFEIPTVYSLMVVAVIPNGKKMTVPEIKTFAEEWEPLKVTAKCIGEKRLSNGDSHLYCLVKAVAVDLILMDREKIKATSLLYALFNQDSPPKSSSWIRVEDGLEYAYPIFDSILSWQKNMENLKLIKFETEPAYEIHFPRTLEDDKGYSSEFTTESDPLSELFSDKLKSLPFPIKTNPQMVRNYYRVFERAPSRFAGPLGLFRKLDVLDVKIALEFLKGSVESSNRYFLR